MNYDEQKKAWKKRRQLMTEMLQRGIPAIEVARKFKVSRQRVHQIAQMAK